METLQRVLEIFAKVGISYFVISFIFLTCVWPINDKDQPWYMWIVATILSGLFVWWII